MTDYVFDTNIVSLLLRCDSNVAQKMTETIESEDIIIGCSVVWYEIRLKNYSLFFSGKITREMIGD